MSDSPPTNGRVTSEQRPERRRPRPREEEYYEDDEESYRGNKRYRDSDERGPRRGFRGEAGSQGPRGERPFRYDQSHLLMLPWLDLVDMCLEDNVLTFGKSRRDAGEYENYNPRARPFKEEGHEPWRNEPKPALNSIMK